MANKIQEAIDDVRRFVTLHRVGQHERGAVVSAEQLGGEFNLPRLLEVKAIAEHDPNVAPATEVTDTDQVSSSSPAPAEGTPAVQQ